MSWALHMCRSNMCSTPTNTQNRCQERGTRWRKEHKDRQQWQLLDYYKFLREHLQAHPSIMASSSNPQTTMRTCVHCGKKSDTTKKREFECGMCNEQLCRVCSNKPKCPTHDLALQEKSSKKAETTCAHCNNKKTTLLYHCTKVTHSTKCDYEVYLCTPCATEPKCKGHTKVLKAKERRK